MQANSKPIVCFYTIIVITSLITRHLIFFENLFIILMGMNTE